MVLADSDGITRVPPYSGYWLDQSDCRLQGSHLLRPCFPTCSTNLSVPCVSPTTPKGKPFGLGSSRFARRYSENRFFFLFLQLLRCFSSLRLPLISYVFTYKWHSTKSAGFPHSDIFGSSLTYSSPKLFGVRPVLHRLLVPRHPPCALIHLTGFG